MHSFNVISEGSRRTGPVFVSNENLFSQHRIVLIPTNMTKLVHLEIVEQPKTSTPQVIPVPLYAVVQQKNG